MSKLFKLSQLTKTKIKPKITSKFIPIKIGGDPSSKGKSEAQIEREICSYLKIKKIKFWKIKIKGERHTFDGVEFYKKSPNKGFADLLLCFRGKFISLEVKKFKGIASTDQLEVQNEVQQAEGIYEFVTSVQEVQKYHICSK